MIKFKRTLTSLVILFLVACQHTPPATTSTAVPSLAPSAIPTLSPKTSTETAVPPAAQITTPPDPTADLSGSLPFDWNDPEIYQSGLIPSARDGVDLLATAPVYSMTVNIDPAAGLVTGFQLIRYTNNESLPLDEIFLHLFPNLLGGSIEISNLKVNEQESDWLYENSDASVMRVPLADPLQPGAAVLLAMDFVTAVPQDVGRNYGVFAQVDDVMALAHFYPLVAVYDDNGWHTDPPVEFGDPTFTDAGFYLVNVSAPDEQVVVGSGVVVDEADNGRVHTQTLAAGPARDFYLVLSPDFAVETVTAGETTIRSYAPAAFAEGARQAAEVAANALRVFNPRLGTYPYTELDIVATPTLALGIEYPGVIAITQREYDPETPIYEGMANSVFLETTVAHEMGHQWFYNIVGNDQLLEPWLDEAMAQYVTGLYYEDLYGLPAAESYRQSWDDRWSHVNYAATPIGLPVGVYDGAAYSAIIYGRGPLFVEALAAEMGQDKFTTFLQAYTHQNEWGIATTESFKTLAEATCQCQLTELFDAWVYAK